MLLKKFEISGQNQQKMHANKIIMQKLLNYYYNYITFFKSNNLNEIKINKIN